MENIENNRDDSTNFIRHSKASYGTYAEIIKSDNPQAPVDKEHQVIPDLTKAGQELAEQESEKFFGQFDPQKDILFFASSNEVRALETANIYRQKAKEKGFEIIKPENVRSNLAEEMGEGEIRTIDNLSLNIENTLLSTIFNPASQLGKANWETVDEETKQRWAEARKIIDSDDKGSWGANFFAHSDEIQKIFPELRSARDVYERKFKNLVKLAEFGLSKAKESNLEKNVKILAFGHENYVGFALDKYFGDHGIANCETIQIKPVDDQLVLERRGQKAVIE